MGAVRTARSAAVMAEIQGLSQGLAAFQTKYGSYPPSRLVLAEDGDYSNANLSKYPGAAALAPRTLREFRRLWPRMVLSTKGPVPTPPGIPGGFYDFDGSGGLSNVKIITGDECLVLFLGGTRQTLGPNQYAVAGLSNNPRNPFYPAPVVTTGTPVNRLSPLFQFKPSRLVDLDNDGLLEYGDFLTGDNDPEPKPYAYFSGYDGAGYDPDDVNYQEGDGISTPATWYGAFAAPNDPTASNAPAVAGYAASASPNPYTSGLPLPQNANGSFNKSGVVVFAWQQAQTFQLISPGQDRYYGVGGDARTGLPDQPQARQDVTGQTPPVPRRFEEDNLTNFKTGPLD
jgi:general secretion pathway protein G